MLVTDREQLGHLPASQIADDIETRRRIIQEYFDSVRDLIKSMQSFERRYEMSTEEMIEEFRSGEISDSPEVTEWLMTYERYRSIVETWPRLESSAPDPA